MLAEFAGPRCDAKRQVTSVWKSQMPLPVLLQFQRLLPALSDRNADNEGQCSTLPPRDPDLDGGRQ